jgi:mRNA-degrading endonuclease toxin of MazEF toxin-antitoxin module
VKSPQRGEGWLVDLGMAAKVRPAVVISVPADDSDRALVTLVSHTTSPRKSRFEVSVHIPVLRAGVFDAQLQSCVLIFVIFVSFVVQNLRDLLGIKMASACP